MCQAPCSGWWANWRGPTFVEDVSSSSSLGPICGPAGAGSPAVCRVLGLWAQIPLLTSFYEVRMQEAVIFNASSGDSNTQSGKCHWCYSEGGQTLTLSLEVYKLPSQTAFLSLWPSCTASRIVVPSEDSNPCPLWWKHSLNHWTTREILRLPFSCTTFFLLDNMWENALWTTKQDAEVVSSF